jgi:hypothetical protein
MLEPSIATVSVHRRSRVDTASIFARDRGESMAPFCGVLSPRLAQLAHATSSLDWPRKPMDDDGSFSLI